MKKIILLCLIFAGATSRAQKMNDITIIPQPVNLKIQKGYFLLDKNTVISTNDFPGAKNIARMLSSYLQNHYDLQLKIANDSRALKIITIEQDDKFKPTNG